MYFLFSGEGPTDMGAGTGAGSISEGDEYTCGPMAVIVDQIVESHPAHQYSPLDSGCCGWVSERQLGSRAGELKAARKSLRLPGPKQPKETRYFFNNARVLARIAREKQAALGDEVVAVLFRDADGTASAGRGLWKDKHDSMLHGFQEEGFLKGVPMLPKPKSEAWIIAGMTGSTNHEGKNLEEWSGNDRSPNALKGALERILDGYPSAKRLCQMVRDRTVDWVRIELTSFTTFKSRLGEVI